MHKFRKSSGVPDVGPFIFYFYTPGFRHCLFETQQRNNYRWHCATACQLCRVGVLNLGGFGVEMAKTGQE